MASCDINTLLASGKKFTQLGGGLNIVARLALLKNILLAYDPAADVSVNTLLDRGKCFSCLTAGQQQIVKLQLLCEIAETAGGGGGGFPGENMVLWLKPETLAGLNPGDAIGTWADSSGQANDADGNNGDQVPFYQPNLLDGHGGAILSDDENSRYFVTPQLFSGAQPRTVFAVYKVSDGWESFAPMCVWSSGQNALSLQESGLYVQNAATNPYFSNRIPDLPGNQVDVDDQFYSDSCRYDGATLSSQRNGVAINSGAFALVTVANSFFIGCGPAADDFMRLGTIIEMMVWDVALTPSQMATVNAYIATKYPSL